MNGPNEKPDIKITDDPAAPDVTKPAKMSDEEFERELAVGELDIEPEDVQPEHIEPPNIKPKDQNKK